MFKSVHDKGLQDTQEKFIKWKKNMLGIIGEICTRIGKGGDMLVTNAFWALNECLVMETLNINTSVICKRYSEHEEQFQEIIWVYNDVGDSKYTFDIKIKDVAIGLYEQIWSTEIAEKSRNRIENYTGRAFNRPPSPTLPPTPPITYDDEIELNSAGEQKENSAGPVSSCVKITSAPE